MLRYLRNDNRQREQGGDPCEPFAQLRLIMGRFHRLGDAFPNVPSLSDVTNPEAKTRRTNHSRH